MKRKKKTRIDFLGPGVPDVPVVPVLRRLGRALHSFDKPAVEKISEDSREDPFQVLISTMLSAQTQDPVTAAASARFCD